MAGVAERVEVVHYDWDGRAQGSTYQAGGVVDDDDDGQVEQQSQSHPMKWAVETASDFAVKHGPFDAIVGAALQFETWEDRLWPTLAALAAPKSVPKREEAGTSSKKNQARRAVTVALATTTGVLSTPPVSSTASAWPSMQWRLMERCSGDRFGMGDLRGGPSEFEVLHMRLLPDEANQPDA
jgi:hypothetical protein